MYYGDKEIYFVSVNYSFTISDYDRPWMHDSEVKKLHVNKSLVIFGILWHLSLFLTCWKHFQLRKFVSKLFFILLIVEIHDCQIAALLMNWIAPHPCTMHCTSSSFSNSKYHSSKSPSASQLLQWAPSSFVRNSLVSQMGEL